MNSVILILTIEEAKHLPNMLWLLKGSEYPDNNWPKSIDTLEKKIDSMAIKNITSITESKITDTTEWPTDY